MKKSFNIQKLLHHKLKHDETKLMHPYLQRAFQRYQEHDLKHLNLGDRNITNKTKQNFLSSFTDRCVCLCVGIGVGEGGGEGR